MPVGDRSVIRQRLDEYWAEAVVPRLFLLRQMPSAGLRMLVPHTIISLTLGLLPVGFVISTSILIGAVPAAVTGGVGSAQWHRMVTVFLAACAVFFAQQALTPLHSSLGTVMKHRVDGYFHDRVIAAATRSTGIGPLEDQESLARLREAVESLETGWRTPGDACAATFALVVRYVRLIGFGIVIAVALSWVWALGICAATMLFRYGHRGGLRIRMRMWPRLMDMRRESAYFRDIGLSMANAKEIRLLGLTSWVVRRYSESHIAYLGPMWRERRRVNVNRFLWFSAVGLLVAATVFILILRSAAQGEITLTQFSLGLQATVAVILLGEFYHEADDATQYGMEAVRALADFEQRADGPGNAVDATPERSGSGDRDVANLPRREIRLARVSFRYPGQMRPVLDGLDLTLRAGECTALVGLNGAGKTTLVKLLARLYEPDAGSVLVDGQDLRDLPVDPWRRQLAVIFQNFNRYQVSAADNIVFGAIDHSSDGAVRRAAEAAGIAEILDTLPRGFQSPLSRTLDGGTDLSGGQWQRIAIARALYALDAGARVLILDEPTAALDVRAEARFFAEFSALTRGVTSLLISHRFSSVRRADRIVVLEHGRITEDGTHDSLMSGGGRYAELFRLQAERFRAGLDAEGDLAPRPADVNEDVP